MSKLLARAKVKLENAKNDYLKIGIDDAYLDDCCYNLQQALEMTLKWLVELEGLNYIENHDLRAQLNCLNKLGVSVPGADRMRILAAEILSWESNSRYNDDFSVVINTVDEVIDLADDLVKYADNKVRESASTNKTIPTSKINSNQKILSEKNKSMNIFNS